MKKRKNFDRLLSDAKAILLEKFEYFKDALEVKVITLKDYNNSASEEGRLNNGALVFWIVESDVIVIDEKWAIVQSAEELAYAYGCVIWFKHYNIKSDEANCHLIYGLAANLRYEMNFNGHDAFSKNRGRKENWTLRDHRQFMNEIRNFIAFEDVSTMDVSGIYDSLMTKKDAIYEKYGYEEREVEEI